jgi:hypothetical protein
MKNALLAKTNDTLTKVEELKDTIEQMNWEGIEKWNITEVSTKRGIRSYDIDGLSIEISDGYIMFIDNYMQLMEEFSALIMLLPEQLDDIKITYIKDKPSILIKFTNGTTVTIDPVL